MIKKIVMPLILVVVLFAGCSKKPKVEIVTKIEPGVENVIDTPPVIADNSEQVPETPPVVTELPKQEEQKPVEKPKQEESKTVEQPKKEPTKPVEKPKQEEPKPVESVKTPQPTPEPAPKPAPEPVPAESPKKETANGFELPNNYAITYMPEFEAGVVTLVNALRAEHGLHPYSTDSLLTTTARYKSNSMNQLDYFSHSNPNLPDQSLGYLLWDIFKVNSNQIGENIAYKASTNPQFTSETLYNLWLNSPPHKEAMLSPSFTKIGVGIVLSNKENMTYLYGTQHFAK